MARHSLGAGRARKSHKARSAHPLIGRELQGVVRDMATNGAGVIALADGVVAFVYGAWVGEEVEFRVVSIKKRVAIGKLTRVIHASDSRIAEPCPYGATMNAPSVCGGCLWQHVNYGAQLAQKDTWVNRSFASLNPEKCFPCQASPDQWQYRNRAELKSDGARLGYIAHQTNNLIDVEHCQVLNSPCQELLAGLRECLPNDAWRTTGKRNDRSNTLLAIDDEQSINDIVPGQRRPFRQANSRQNDFMQHWLHEHLLPVNKASAVLELFCGAGNFTSVISQLEFGAVYAAEGVESAVDALAAKGFANVTPAVVDLFDERAFENYLKALPPVSTLVLDPPRDGLKVIAPLLKLKSLKNILYISCNLATCQRDVQQFVAGGFRLLEVQPVDQFPQTPHLELCVALAR